MSVEVVASIIAGLIIGKSFALLAFAGDSVIELISAFAVMEYMRSLMWKPGFSRGLESKRIERVALVLLILLVPTISGGAIYSYFAGVKPEASLLGIAVAFGAAIIMPILWIQKRSVGREANVFALSLDAVESATCFFMSIALLGGLILNYFFNLAWADYVATGIILFFVTLEIRESFKEMKE
jgi:divalent metal cation (Fe/Co/Zn/Cd) transporter